MMNPRKEKFVGEYLLNGGNATKAAEAAGYSPKTAYAQGCRLLKDAEIAARIAAARKEVMAALKFDAEQWLKDGLELARSDIGDYFTEDGALKKLKDMTPEQRRAIASVEVEAETEKHGRMHKIKLWPKNEARDQIARHLGLYERDNAQVGQSFASLVRAATQKRKAEKR